MRRTIAALLLLGVSGCAAATGPDFQDEAPVLLEIEYTNLAWRPVWNGYYIDAGGTLYSWNASGRDPEAAGRDEFTHAELMQKLTARRKRVRSLDENELKAVANLIPAAAAAAVSPQEFRCADAGVLVYRAYTFDSTRGVFRPVLLRSEGDRIQQNTSQAARQIYAYLHGLEVMQPISGCQPD